MNKRMKKKSTKKVLAGLKQGQAIVIGNTLSDGNEYHHFPIGTIVYTQYEGGTKKEGKYYRCKTNPSNWYGQSIFEKDLMGRL